LTVAANEDVAAYHHRQMAVLTRAQRLNWLDAVVPEDQLLRPMPVGSFRVREEGRKRVGQGALAL
jgi:putative SOS response-associated peptidase YedK